MNDITTYGLLFQLDKRWQRLQGRRLRLLEKLSSPMNLPVTLIRKWIKSQLPFREFLWY